MTFYERLDEECKKRGTTPTALLKSLKVSTSKLTAWKNGSMPSSEWVILISESLGTPIEYLLTGKETTTVPEIKTYHSNFPEIDEISKKYNAICRSLRVFNGKKDAFALLSAVGIPNDKPVAFTEAQLNYLAFKTGINAVFFEDKDIGKCDADTMYAKAKACTFDRDFDFLDELEAVYPEAKQWESNYKFLSFQAMQIGVNLKVFEEMTSILSRFNDKAQIEINAIFKKAVEEYEEQLKKKMARELDDTSAERKGEVS